MKAYRFHPHARAEMIEAGVYYESQQEGLGHRYLAAVQEAISRVRINPRLYPTADLGCQRCLAKTFPYSVIYEDGPTEIVVMAVMHMHRQPDYWKMRRANDDE